MKKYIDMYKDDLLHIFNKDQTISKETILVLKDDAVILDTSIKTFHYQDDFESSLHFSLPTKNRKTKQLLSLNECNAIIKKATFGVLSFSYQDLPYAIGINHVYKDDKLYFHTGYTGFKLKALNQRISYLIMEDLGINEVMATHNHSSVRVQGILKQVDDKKIKKEVLEFLMKELAPTNDKVINEAMVTNTNILVLDIECINGKVHIR